jgi:cytochrome bd-type quinol oxidase subunit 1
MQQLVSSIASAPPTLRWTLSGIALPTGQPLQTCVVCGGDGHVSDIPDTLVYFSSLDWLFYGSGLVMILLGFMAWAIHKKNSHRHSWGKRIFGMGVLFTLIGFNMGAFMALLNYILQ